MAVINKKKITKNVPVSVTLTYEEFIGIILRDEKPFDSFYVETEEGRVCLSIYDNPTVNKSKQIITFTPKESDREDTFCEITSWSKIQ